LRVVTLNVNGIRSAARKGLYPWLAAQKADVICLQEVKAQQADLDGPPFALKASSGTCIAPRKRAMPASRSTAGASRERGQGFGVKEFDAEGAFSSKPTTASCR
jgi:exodeoxyribonuclease-3